MSEDMEKLIETIPQLIGIKGEKQVILRLEDLLTEKPRASVKEIEAAYRLLKMLDNQKKYHSYTKKETCK